MRKSLALSAGFLALVLVAAAGCASSGSTATTSTAASMDASAFPISITVDNNLRELKPATVTIIGPNVQKILGPVDSGRRRTFSYTGRAGTYAFQYRTTSPNDPIVVSQQVQIAGAMGFTWHLASNSLVEGQ